mgnify:FL=1
MNTSVERIINSAPLIDWLLTILGTLKSTYNSCVRSIHRLVNNIDNVVTFKVSSDIYLLLIGFLIVLPNHNVSVYPPDTSIIWSNSWGSGSGGGYCLLYVTPGTFDDEQ